MVRFNQSRTISLAIAIGLCLLAQTVVFAQPGRGGDRRSRGGFGGGGFGGGSMDPERMRQWMERMRGMQPSAAPEKKEDEKPPAEKPDGEAEKDDGPWHPEPVKRGPWPRWPANPAELDASPDEDGMLSFRFQGQPWPAVLEWLADLSQMSLQWEETPPGFLNLAPRGKHSIAEVRDLITSVLLSKGYALLRKGDVLIVANAKSLNAGLVPRVSLAELDERGDHELVKVLFDLDWLMAETIAEEFKPLLGPYGQITALKTANRLDVLSVVANLRRMRELLGEEQSHAGQKGLVREFRLRHTRAADVLEKLQVLLGVDPKNSDPAQAMLTQMAAQQSGDRGRGRRDRERGGSDGDRGAPGMLGLAAGPPKADFYLAVNARTNSVLVNAPPDKMATIEQAIAVIDVAQPRNGSPLDRLPRVQTYRLGGLAPETLVKVLTELGGLDPTARLEIDASHGAIIAYAPLADQMVIRTLVEMLDGKGRRFEVIQLRTLGAEFVAGSIQTLLTGPEQADSSGRRSYDDSSRQQEESDRFQVEADTEHNRLLLRATEVELAEVRSLLVKLGEIPAAGRNASTVRMIPAPAGEETERLLERIERLWPALGPNPLEVEPAENGPAEEGPAASSTRRSSPKKIMPESPMPREKSADRTSEADLPGDSREGLPPQRFHFAQESRVRTEEPVESVEVTEKPAAVDPAAVEPAAVEPAAEDAAPPAVDPPAVEAHGAASDAKADANDSADDAPARQNPIGSQEPLSWPGRELPRAAHAPVKVTVGPYGLVISSSDAQALDRLEELIGNFMPARLTYKVFQIKNSYAKDLAILLEDIYKNEEAENSSNMDMFGGSRRSRSRGQSSEPARNTLSKRRPLNFVADPVTNTILVQGADASQLAEIESLIKLYDGDDVPEPKSVRRTELVSLRYAKAVDVAEVVKDVFRDLLSPNDKALQRGMGQPQQQREGGSRPSVSYLSDDVEKSAGIPKFKGMLSVGIDERANGLAISAPQILLKNVLEMVDQLDRAAKPTRAVVRVQKLRQPLSASQIERALGPKKGASSASPPAEAAAKPSQPSPSSPSSGRRRDAEAAAN